MAQKISKFPITTSISSDGYMSLIDIDNAGTYNNYKLSIRSYFYNQTEIDNLINSLETKIDSISSISKNDLKNLKAEILAELNKKQNKDVEIEDRVIVSDDNGIISTSDITIDELNCLKNIKNNIQSQIDEIQKDIENLSVDINGNTLIGEVKWFAGPSKPAGRYLICDGSAVSRTTYAELFKAIGTVWGTGDGKTTFNLPNLISRVAWGVKSISSTKTAHYIAAGLPNITGKFDGNTNDGHAKTGAFYVDGGLTPGSDGENNIGGYIGFNASRCSSIYGKSSTVQPPATTLIPVIRY